MQRNDTCPRHYESRADVFVQRHAAFEAARAARGTRRGHSVHVASANRSHCGEGVLGSFAVERSRSFVRLRCNVLMKIV